MERILARSSQSHRRLWILSAIVLGVFAGFIVVVRLVAFHDDAYNIPIINTQTVLSVFDIRPYGHRDYRPVIAALWLLVRDGFGGFVPALLHAFSLATHVVTTALVMALSLRLARSLPASRMQHTALAVFAGLLFAFFPFWHQAVLWAGAIGHPLMVMFGLLGAFAGLEAARRRSFGFGAMVILCLLFACWSHEQGFMFGALIPLVLIGERFIQQRRPSRFDLLVCVIFLAAGAAYALFYQSAIATVWINIDSLNLRAAGPADWLRNLAFNMQAFVLGLVVLLRYRLLDVFDASQVPALLFALFALVVVPALWAMRRLHVWRLGIVALAFWGVALVPSAVFLSPDYIEGGPRILYPAAVGIALFWATLIGALLVQVRSPALKLATVLAPLLFITWGGLYIADRAMDLDAFSRAIRSIAGDLRGVSGGTRVLLINFPAASAPKDPGPAFLQGNEGVMFHTDYNGPADIVITALTGVALPTTSVRHDASLRENQRALYFVAGEPVDDAQLRERIQNANVIFSFDYSGERVRVRRLATLQPDAQDAATLAKLSQNEAQVRVREATAMACDGRLQVQIAWGDARGMSQPAGVFVHGYDAQGSQILGADDDLVNGALPLEQMPANTLLTEQREIELKPDQTVPSEVRIGVYTREGVQRWAATRADGSAWDGDEIRVTVSVCR